MLMKMPFLPIRPKIMPKAMGEYKRWERLYLGKPVYTAGKPSDCHYCCFWTNDRKGSPPVTFIF